MNVQASKTRRLRDSGVFANLSLGAWVIVGLAVVSTVLVAVRAAPSRAHLELWTYARTHTLNYQPIIARWNAQAAESARVELYLIGPEPLERRMQSGFFSGTPLADLIEVERDMSGRLFSGPLEDVGFADLTDRLREEGILDQLNAPSFSPWTSRGRIFGLPHDVHPVLLGYRADIVEAAGIDVATIETWDDFARVLRPLIRDLDGDGQPDRYLLNLWHTNRDLTEVLLLQAGGGYFDETGRIIIDSEANARVLTTIVSWICGPNRIAIDAPEFTASGNQLRVDGAVVGSLMADWLCGVWRNDIPQLAGKIKLMPLPAWEPGGRRASVWGGTMLGIARTTPNFDEAWAFAKHLYLSQEMAETLYRNTGIISPVKQLWGSACYDEPDKFFCGQAPGRWYISAAPHVPRRTASPFNRMAKYRVQDVLGDLRRYAIEHEVYEPPALLGEAHRLLALAAADIRQRVDHNVFYRTSSP